MDYLKIAVAIFFLSLCEKQASVASELEDSDSKPSMCSGALMPAGDATSVDILELKTIEGDLILGLNVRNLQMIFTKVKSSTEFQGRLKITTQDRNRFVEVALSGTPPMLTLSGVLNAEFETDIDPQRVPVAFWTLAAVRSLIEFPQAKVLKATLYTNELQNYRKKRILRFPASPFLNHFSDLPRIVQDVEYVQLVEGLGFGRVDELVITPTTSTETFLGYRKMSLTVAR